MIAQAQKKKTPSAPGKPKSATPVRVTKISDTPRCLTPAGIAVYEIPLDAIRITQKTVHTCTPESIAALAQSIHKYGVIHPLTVKTTYGGGYELVCGERRLRAVKLLGLSTVRCMVINADAARSDAVRLCENFHTVEPHYLDIAEAIGQFCEKHACTPESAAARLCLSEIYTKEKLRLLEFSAEERAKTKSSGIEEGVLLTLLSVADSQARSILLDEIIKKGLSAEETDRLLCSYIKKRRFIPVPKQHTYLIRDVRIFYNTVDRAIELMRRAGYNITANKQQTDDATLITVRIPKER